LQKIGKRGPLKRGNKGVTANWRKREKTFSEEKNNPKIGGEKAEESVAITRSGDTRQEKSRKAAIVREWKRRCRSKKG